MNATDVEPRTSLRTRLALATTPGYLSLLLAQLCLPFLAGIVVRIPFDTPFVRSTVEIARDMRARGDDAYPLVYPGIWLDHVIPEGPELFPVSGVSHKLTVFCDEHSTSHYSEQGNALVAEVAVRALLDGR